jgi:L-threonylcarbamoyladenylate synthase
LAFRLPADEELRAFLRETGPLIAPSANPEGKSPATTIAEARTYFGEMVDSYQEAGILSGAPSTLVTIEEGKIRILREGSVTIPDEIRLY